MSLFVCGTWTENGQRRQDVESEKFKSTLKQLKTEIFPQKKKLLVCLLLDLGVNLGNKSQKNTRTW